MQESDCAGEIQTDKSLAHMHCTLGPESHDPSSHLHPYISGGQGPSPPPDPSAPVAAGELSAGAGVPDFALASNNKIIKKILVQKFAIFAVRSSEGQIITST